MDEIISRSYMDRSPLKTEFNVNIGCVMSLKWSRVRSKCCRIGFSLWNTHNTSWSAPHNHMAPPNLSTLPHKNEVCHNSVDSTPNLEDSGCSLIFAKVTNPNIVKAATKSSCITHAPNYSYCIAH